MINALNVINCHCSRFQNWTLTIFTWNKDSQPALIRAGVPVSTLLRARHGNTMASFLISILFSVDFQWDCSGFTVQKRKGFALEWPHTGKALMKYTFAMFTFLLAIAGNNLLKCDKLCRIYHARAVFRCFWVCNQTHTGFATVTGVRSPWNNRTSDEKNTRLESRKETSLKNKTLHAGSALQNRTIGRLEWPTASRMWLELPKLETFLCCLYFWVAVWILYLPWSAQSFRSCLKTCVGDSNRFSRLVLANCMIADFHKKVAVCLK